MYEKRTTPGSIGQVLDNAFRLFKESFVYCIPAAILVAVANAAPQLPNISPTLIIELPWLFVALVVLSYYLIALSMPTIIHRMNGFAEGTREPFKANVSFGLKKSLFVLGAFILYGLALIGGMILLIVPGLILAVSLSLFLYAMVIDDSGAVASLKQSHRLVWGNWWRTVAIFTVGFAIAMVLYFIAMAILGVAAAFMFGDSEAGPALGFRLALVAVVLLINFFMTPLFTALGLVVYNDLKLRKQGKDLEARVDELQTA